MGRMLYFIIHTTCFGSSEPTFLIISPFFTPFFGYSSSLFLGVSSSMDHTMEDMEVEVKKEEDGGEGYVLSDKAKGLAIATCCHHVSLCYLIQLLQLTYILTYIRSYLHTHLLRYLHTYTLTYLLT